MADKEKRTSESEPAAPPLDEGWTGELDLAELDRVLSEGEAVRERDDAGSEAGLSGDLAAPALGADAPGELPELPDLPDPADLPPVALVPKVATPAPAAAAESGSVLDDRDAFRREAQRLVRARDWQALAALTGAALDSSRWAQQTEVRAALLGDLARIYRDRLRDLPSAEDHFRRLVEVAPANAEANRFLAQRYRERGDFRPLYDLRLAAVEATWDPTQRLEWTRDAAAIAAGELASDELAIEAWERLWRLGDAQEETARALSETYRRAARWDRLADFLERRAQSLKGPEQIVVQRELAEACLAGLRDHDRAEQVLGQLLSINDARDPVALLSLARVYARRGDWEALAALGARAIDGVPQAALRDLRRLAADALWGAEEHDRAIAVYDRLLELDPTDAEALRAKEAYLLRQRKIDALVQLLSKRAETTQDPAERAALLERAADLAESELGAPREAVALLERRAAIEPGRAHALEALVVLYDSLGDHEGVRRALEALLQLTRNPRARIDVLRRLGDHCAHRLGDDERAEACWRQVLDAVPDDRAVREELTALYRRRGDFEAVDRTLSAQAWRALDDEALVSVWRAAAVNLQENMSDPERTVRAWRRVTDLRPDDAIALKAIVPHRRALGRVRELIDALEAELRVTDEPAQRVQLALEIARLWEGEKQPAGALAAYERVLRLAPDHREALAASARLRGPAQAGVSRGALDAAVARLDGDARSAVLRQALQLEGERDALGRFFALRRLLWACGTDAVAPSELQAAAQEAGAFEALAAVLESLIAAADGGARAALVDQLAGLQATQLGSPTRAFLTLQAGRLRPATSLAELEPLLKLAEATGRPEDALALLGGATASSAPPEVRRAAILKRARICEEQLGSPERAYHEVARLVRLDPRDGQALAEARRLAVVAKQFRELSALYAELGDRAETHAERVELLRARRALAAGELADPMGALDLGLAIYRLDPALPGLEAELLEQAEALSAWDRVLPIVEARVRAQAAAADELERLAGLYEAHAKDPARAFELYGCAFVARPDAPALEQRLTALADDPARLVERLREAAGRAGDPVRALDLYARAAALYAGPVGRPDLALDVHQRILQLKPSSLESLEVIIAHQRAAGLWRELRDSLQAWSELEGTAGDPRRLERLLEIARLSQGELRDPETALATYAQILALDPQNADALEGIRTLTTGAMEPALELKRLRLELERAAGARRVELQLACARIQEADLEDPAGAIATLRELVAESGPAGAGYEPLAKLYTQRGAWGELVDLMEQRAAALAEKRARVETLERALAVCDEHPTVPAERRERLCLRLIGLEPDHEGVRRRLLRLYRSGARYEELQALLQASLERTPDDEGLQAERIRVLDLALGRTAEAEQLLKAALERRPDDAGALLYLASMALRRGEREAHLKLRERHAEGLPGPMRALVLCHLAEAWDDLTHDPEQVVAYYRQARACDPENRFAMQGLKALGRRVKGWRTAAALLPDAAEPQLSWAERGGRLREMGRAANDAESAISLFQRAVAVNPDDHAAWDALAEAHERRRELAQAVEARRAALAAFERVTAPEPASLPAHAARLEALASLLRGAGDEAEGARLSARAHALDPSLPAAALAVADKLRQAGDVEEAHALYSAVLAERRLTPAEHLHATFQRGAIAAARGHLDQAITDLREGLRIDELHPGLLRTLADVLAQKGRIASAAQHYTQALLLATEPRVRGQLYARLGRLWEDHLARPDEAGVCYHFARSAGVDDADLMMRALAYYRRVGQGDRAAEVIAHLLPRTTAPAELATLWAERGHLTAADDDAKAMEAFDMALSYDPRCRSALDGLIALLERRGEWGQLVDMLEARLEADMPPADRARSLRSLARISREQLKDAARAEQQLRAALALDPQLEDYDALLELIGDGADRAADRQDVVAARLTLAGPWTPHLVEMGRARAAAGQRGWAWCLLSPLMNTIISDQGVKTLVLELRKEFEKVENVTSLSPTTHRRALDPRVPQRLLDVLAEIDREVPLGPQTPAEVGATRVVRIDAKVALGKAFQTMSEQLVLPDAILSRADELPVPFRVIDDDVPHIVARNDLLGLLSPNETNALFAMLLEQARPGARLLCSLEPVEAVRLVETLLAALRGGAEARDPLIAKILEYVDESRWAAWATALRDVEVSPPDVVAGVQATSRRVALVAAGELRYAAKMLTRLEEGAKLPSAGKLEDLDHFFAASARVREIVGFATSSGFGALLGR